MPVAPAPLPSPVDRGPFLTSTARAAGVTANRLRRRDLVAPTRGVRLRSGDADDLEARCRAVLLALPAGTVLSHVTALRLAGIEVPWRLEDDRRLHVTVPGGGPEPRRAGVRTHRAAVVEGGPLRGLPVAPPARTWCDLGADLDVDDLVVLGDAMLRRQDPRTDLDGLAAALASRPVRSRGRARLRTALPDVRAGTDSTMESRTRLAVVRAGLPCPEVNRPVLDEHGRFVALPDLSYPELRIALEYDGDVHRTDQRTWRRDVGRRERLGAAGWLVVTVTADDVVRHPERLLHLVRRARAARSSLR